MKGDLSVPSRDRGCLQSSAALRACNDGMGRLDVEQLLFLQPVVEEANEAKVIQVQFCETKDVCRSSQLSQTNSALQFTHCSKTTV